MVGYVVGRLLALVPVLFGLSLIVFLIMALIPGDPAQALLGSYATPENVARINRDLGLDRSLPVQYLTWLGNVLTGDFGISIATKRPVIGEFSALFPATLELATVAMILAVLIGIPAGIFAAVKRGSIFDRGARLDLDKPGTGLGLAIVRDVAEIYGGSVTLEESEDLGGLLVRLRLPAA